MRKLRIKAYGEAPSGDQESRMKKGPCYRCTRRTITCHGVCEEYKAWRAELEAIKEDLRQKKGECNISQESLRKHWRNLRVQCRKYVKK